ncbi:BTAD domain-containing putative transcriptional regulator [Flindersiella endophytica]
MGPLEVRDGERRVEIRGTRPLTVLALLLVSVNHEVSPDQLVDGLWPEGPPASAVGTLHSLIHRLRQHLGEVELRRGEFGYALHVPPDRVDFCEFERLAAAGRAALDAADPAAAVVELRAALELWRGMPFAGIEAEAVRKRADALCELRLDVMEWCLAAELSLDRHEAIVSELESLVAEHPFRERFWHQLMAALHRSGRQADALAVYQRLYRLLDEELGVRPSEAIREFHQNILADEGVAQEQPREADPLAPRMVPMSARDFTGRAEELTALDNLLATAGEQDAQAVTVASIGGMGGIGKTTLAVHWAHQVRDQFPDGQLYVNLRGFDPSGQPMDSAEALGWLLEALGVPPERAPVQLESRAAMYRSLLSGRRVLVVLDNAVDEQQVRPLLPASPGCMVLVTSRNQLTNLVTAEAAQPLSLGPLADSEAYEFLSRRIGRERLSKERQAAEQILDLCAGLPLALAMVAGRAALRPTFSLEMIAAQLDRSKTGAAPVSRGAGMANLWAVFSWSYERLDTESARMFRLLGLHPGPDIADSACASLVGGPLTRVQIQLDDLSEALLIDEHLPGRYAMHDLLRTYAVELTRTHDTETDRRSGVQRVVDHYLHSALPAAVLLEPHRDDTRVRASLVDLMADVTPDVTADGTEAMAWFRAERDVLPRIVHLAAASGLDVHVWQLTWAIDDFYNRQVRHQVNISCGRLAVEAARRQGDRYAEARAIDFLGRNRIWQGRFEEGKQLVLAGLELYTAIDDRWGQGTSHQNLGFLLTHQDQYAAALEHQQQALELYRSVGKRADEANALNGLGWNLAQLGDLDPALSACRQAAEIQREIGDNDCLANSLDSIGFIHHQLSQYDQAITHYQEAVDLYRNGGRPGRVAGTLIKLGDSQHAAGDPTAARRSWQEALSILEELGHPDAEKARAKLR